VSDEQTRRVRLYENENMQCNPYLWLNRRDFCILKEIGVKKHDGDVRF